jgi:hypothetical protein
MYTAGGPIQPGRLEKPSTDMSRKGHYVKLGALAIHSTAYFLHGFQRVRLGHGTFRDAL